MYKWNDKSIERHYTRELRNIKEHRYNFTDEELESLYLDRLSHQTKSKRILRMITLAYCLGKLKGIKEVDEGKSTVGLR